MQLDVKDGWLKDLDPEKYEFGTLFLLQICDYFLNVRVLKFHIHLIFDIKL